MPVPFPFSHDVAQMIFLFRIYTEIATQSLSCSKTTEYDPLFSSHSFQKDVSKQTFEPRHEKTNKVSMRPADLTLRWAHTHFVGFVMSWLK